MPLDIFDNRYRYPSLDSLACVAKGEKGQYANNMALRHEYVVVSQRDKYTGYIVCVIQCRCIVFPVLHVHVFFIYTSIVHDNNNAVPGKFF